MWGRGGVYKSAIIGGELEYFIYSIPRPSQERVEWATQLIKEFREHESKGKGAFTFRGSMIDEPLVKQAQNIVDMAQNFEMTG